ncbi:MAG: alpha/beta fold hydrolase, partial [Caulobacteraceae bacterium]
MTDAGPRLFAGDRMVILPRISVEVIGEGPDLVFIPGLASSRATWKATAERLRSRYRLHLVQVAGFAGDLARANASGAVVVPTAEAIADYIEGAHLAPATIIGHSLGGTIALWLAENRPADVRPVLVVDALPFFARVMLGPKASVASITPMAERIRHAPALPLSQTAKMMDAMVTGAAERAMVLAWSEESDPTTITN